MDSVRSLVVIFSPLVLCHHCFVVLSFFSSIFREFSGVIFLLLPAFPSKIFVQNVHFPP